MDEPSGLPTVIIPDWKSGPSSNGNSYWDRFQSGCPHQAGLDKQYADALRELAIEADLPEATDVGSAFHKILEHYYRGTLSQVAFDDSIHYVKEALRLFKTYRSRFPPDEFGKVVGSEIEFSLPESLALDLVGVPAFTGRIDLVVEVTQEAVEGLRRMEGRNLVSLVTPGIYLIDHKTMKRHDRDVEKKFYHGFQFHVYQAAWNALYPDRPALGAIANCITRTLLPETFSVFVPPPTPVQCAAFKAHYAKSYALKQFFGDDFKNRSKCFDWNKTCAHFNSGACDRS